MDAFYGEIRIFGFNFPPENWAVCNGQQMTIAQNQVLYAVIGTQFGGDGKTNYKLPNLMGSAVCQSGQGPGLTNRVFGKAVGSSGVNLSENQIPDHQHQINAVAAPLAQLTNIPTGTSYIARTAGQLDYTNTDVYDTAFGIQTLGSFGSGGVHENRQPYLAMNFCICTYGEFPARS